MTNTIEVEIKNELGIHARPANHLVKLASEFQAELFILNDELRVNGKSIMGVLMLQAGQGDKIKLEAVGPDSAELLSAVSELIANGFFE